MIYTRRNRGVCSRQTTVKIEDGKVVDIEVIGGCPGNLNGICSIVKGLPAEFVIERFKGVRCGMKSTSCPDQIAACIEEALAQA